MQQPEVIDQLLAQRAENSRKISALIPLLEKQCESDEEKRLLETVKETRSAYVDSYQRALTLLLVKKDRNAATDMMLQRTYSCPAAAITPPGTSSRASNSIEVKGSPANKASSSTPPPAALCSAFDFLVALLAGGIALIATRKVARVVNSRIRMQQQVYRLNAELEQRVTQRTLELQRTENQPARFAGRAAGVHQPRGDGESTGGTSAVLPYS